MIGALGVAIIDRITPFRRPPVALALFVPGGVRPQRYFIGLERLAIAVQRQGALGFVDDNEVDL